MIQFFKSNFNQTDVHVIKKIYFTHARRLIIKVELDGNVGYGDIDLRAIPTNIRRTYKRELNQAAHSPYIERVNVYPDGTFSINLGGIHTSHADPSGAGWVNSDNGSEIWWTYTLPDNPTYPLYVYLGSGETATPDSGTFVVPSWLPAGRTRTLYLDENKYRLSWYARYIFDEGLTSYLPYNSDGTVTQRSTNTILRGKALLGYAWRELHNLPNADSTYTLETMTDLLQRIEADLGDSPADIGEWYSTHLPSIWSLFLADADEVSNRCIWLSDDSGGTSGSIYDVNAANRVDGILDSAAAAAEWQDLLTTQYDAAFDNWVERDMVPSGIPLF